MNIVTFRFPQIPWMSPWCSQWHCSFWCISVLFSSFLLPSSLLCWENTHEPTPLRKLVFMPITCSSFSAFLSLLFSSHSSWARDPFRAAPDLSSTILPFFLPLSASGAQEIPLIRACPNSSFILKTRKTSPPWLKHRAKSTGQTNHPASVLPTRVCSKAGLSLLPSPPFTPSFCLRSHFTWPQHGLHNNTALWTSTRGVLRRTCSILAGVPQCSQYWHGAGAPALRGVLEGSEFRASASNRAMSETFLFRGKSSAECYNLHHDGHGLDAANRAWATYIVQNQGIEAEEAESIPLSFAFIGELSHGGIIWSLGSTCAGASGQDSRMPISHPWWRNLTTDAPLHAEKTKTHWNPPSFGVPGSWWTWCGTGRATSNSCVNSCKKTKKEPGWLDLSKVISQCQSCLAAAW